MRVLMCGGGTGGHVNPAIAIANKIKELESDSEIAFVGTGHGIESKLVPKEGYKLYQIEIRGIKRSLSLQNIKTAFLCAEAFIKCRKIIKSFKPDIVIGTGGYACWPVIRAASALRVHCVLHESNAVPGFAVKMLESHVDRIYVNFEDTLKALKYPNRAVRVGNPLKGGFADITRGKAREKLGIPQNATVLLSLGGSMGAETVNNNVLKVMRDYTSLKKDIIHYHATGSIEYNICKEQFESMGLDKCENIHLSEYIYDMPNKMAAADVVINRAGAMTLSELALLGRASILIPSPNVTNNHQFKNADVLRKAGAAVLIEEKELDETRLTEAVKMLCEDNEKRESMEKAVAAFAVSDAAEVIYNDIKKLIN
ncbi:MAG: undecaprenyldiphospho-muramoylpentapeptide beta-N-acetylglucosaminyltransferase [Clostridia bacterium]|nr:undecaprenyldiphospho-muramoylpentapeptide beta-N-acetylglucosaminyltransferase [Clostridia bacterium]